MLFCGQFGMKPRMARILGFLFVPSVKSVARKNTLESSADSPPESPSWPDFRPAKSIALAPGERLV